jgi:hypothetical protein
MHNGDIDRNRKRRRLLVGVLALTVAGSLAACTTTEHHDANITAGTDTSQPVVNYFGPDHYGKLTIGMTEKEALATGELQSSPVSTVLGKNVYSFVDGPKPDPKRMAADAKLEQAVKKADANTSTSAADSAKGAKTYADSTQRIVDRLVAYLSAGGATFQKGALTDIAAPKDAATEAGIKRGSTLTELKAAYASRGLKGTSKSVYELPVTGKPGWTIMFELGGDTVKYMSLGKAG